MTSTNISREIDSDTARRLRWFGWAALGSVVVGWSAWVSVTCINSLVVQERESRHYEQLREDISDVGDDVAAIKAMIQNQPGRIASH